MLLSCKTTCCCKVTPRNKYMLVDKIYIAIDNPLCYILDIARQLTGKKEAI